MPSRTRKFRGSRTHGRGIKAGRGAGKQGGRGNAGLHKYKFKSMLIYAPDHFGRHGFKRPPEAVDHPVAVNVGELAGLVPRLKEEKALQQEGNTWVADLSAIGVDRLLGGGAVEGSWKVKVAHASAHAREKVEVLEGEGAPAPAAAPALPKSGAPAQKPAAKPSSAPAASAPAGAPKSPPRPKPAPGGAPSGGAAPAPRSKPAPPPSP